MYIATHLQVKPFKVYINPFSATHENRNATCMSPILFTPTN